MGTRLPFVVHTDRGYGYVGASRCRNAAGLYYFKRLRRSDWLPIGGGDSDEESERGYASNAESVDAYDGWCGDCTESDCSTLRSDGHLQPSDADSELDEDGNYRTHIDDPTTIDQTDFTPIGEPEPTDAYYNFADAKRRKTAE